MDGDLHRHGTFTDELGERRVGVLQQVPRGTASTTRSRATLSEARNPTDVQVIRTR